jgi:endoglucanase
MVDRRTMVASVLLSTLFGCAASPPAAKPQDPWKVWKSRFVQPDGRVTDTGNAGISHSEGQGYGMLLAEAAGDRVLFDRIWGWTDAVLGRRDMRLFSWRFDPSSQPPVSDPNNATDGDILIAWALLRAAKRWGSDSYASHSRAIRVAIGSNLVVSVYGRIILLPGLAGFVTSQRTTVNPSYYVWPALDAFQAEDPEGPWSLVIDHGEKLITDCRFGFASLPTDWVDLDPTGPVHPAEGKPAHFGYDAIRVPLYLTWSRRIELAAPFRTYWSDFTNFTPWIDVFTGERASFAMSEGGRAVAKVTLGNPISGTVTPADDYYSATLFLLARTALQEARLA